MAENTNEDSTIELTDDIGNDFTIDTESMTGRIYFSYDGWDTPRKAIRDIKYFMEGSNDNIAEPIDNALNEIGYEIDGEAAMTSDDSVGIVMRKYDMNTDEEYYEGEPNDNCEKCGRTYDDIGYDYQYCKACGWDAENQKWDKPIKPTNADYLAGEADILTGRWW